MNAIQSCPSAVAFAVMLVVALLRSLTVDRAHSICWQPIRMQWLSCSIYECRGKSTLRQQIISIIHLLCVYITFALVGVFVVVAAEMKQTVAVRPKYLLPLKSCMRTVKRVCIFQK